MQRSSYAPAACGGLVLAALTLGKAPGYSQSWAGTPSWMAQAESRVDLGPDEPGGLAGVVEDAPESSRLWENQVGGGYRKGVWLGEATAGVGIGMRAMGARQEHDFLLTSVQAGRMLTGLVGEGHWYQGNFECLGTFFGGAQTDPDTDYIVGFNPGARYHFATGTRVIPFIGLSAGVALTDIKEPDLSTLFQFNEQYGMGLHWYLRDHLALSLEYRFLHISNAGIKEPNAGVNSNLILGGLNWKF